jgi:hypothetical protein
MRSWHGQYRLKLASAWLVGGVPGVLAFDKAWIEAIDPARHGFRFDRVTTIGRDGSHCPFHFSRTPRPEKIPDWSRIEAVSKTHPRNLNPKIGY